MAEYKKKKRRVFPGMIVFVLLCGALLLVAGTRMITDLLLAYEQSRPEHFMHEYMESFDEEHVAQLSEHVTYEYDENLLEEETLQRLFCETFPFNAELSYRRDGALCSGNRMGYSVINDNKRLGTVVIEQEVMPELKGSNQLMRLVSQKVASILGCSYGAWNVVSEEFVFQTPQADHLTVTIPESWKVECNGYILDAGYRKGEPKQMEQYAEYYEMLPLPMLVTYEVNAYTDGGTLKIYNEEGKEVVLSSDSAVNERMFTEKYFDNGNAEVQDFVKDFLTRYIRYGSGAVGNRYDNLASLQQVLVPGSDFESRMKQALDGLYYAHSRGDVITDVTFNAILELEDGWFADITYVLDTTGNKGVVTTSHNAKLVMVMYNGALRLSQLTSY